MTEFKEDTWRQMRKKSYLSVDIQACSPLLCLGEAEETEMEKTGERDR